MIYPSFSGDEEAFPATAIRRMPIEVVRSYALPESVTNLEQVKIVSLVIDTRTGHIVNADESPLLVPPTGMRTYEPDRTSVRITREGNGCLRISTNDGVPICSIELYLPDGRCIGKSTPRSNSCTVSAGTSTGIVKIVTSQGTTVRKVVP